MKPPLERSATCLRSRAVPLPGAGWQQRSQGRNASEDDGEGGLDRAVCHGVRDRVSIVVKVHGRNLLQTQSTDDAGEKATRKRGDEGRFSGQRHLQAHQTWNRQKKYHDICHYVDGTSEDIRQELISTMPARDSGIPVEGQRLADEKSSEYSA